MYAKRWDTFECTHCYERFINSYSREIDDNYDGRILQDYGSVTNNFVGRFFRSYFYQCLNGMVSLM